MVENKRGSGAKKEEGAGEMWKDGGFSLVREDDVSS